MLKSRICNFDIFRLIALPDMLNLTYINAKITNVRQKTIPSPHPSILCTIFSKLKIWTFTVLTLYQQYVVEYNTNLQTLYTNSSLIPFVRKKLFTDQF